MDIHHFIGKKADSQTYWVYTQKGYDYMVSKQTSSDNLESRKPGMPVAEHYRQSCPMWWVYNGWVEEAVVEVQLTLF